MPLLRIPTIKYAICVLAFVLSFGVAHNVIAGNALGSACTNGAVAPIVNSTNDDGNNLVCISGTWQYPAYALQSYSGAAGASCSSYPTGAMHYNTTINNVEYCNGTIWNFLAGGTTTCGAPSGLTFTSLTSQTLGAIATNATPATITFSGCSTLLVSVSGVSTAQTSINGGPWGTGGTIVSGQTLNVRMTTSTSANTTLTATINVGSSSTTWATTTKAAALHIFRTPTLYAGTAIGDLSGADTLCQSAATSAGYSWHSTAKAVMSDDTTSAASRLTLSYPIVNAFNGNTVSTINLWNGSISNKITDTAGLTSGCCNYDQSSWSGTLDTGAINTGNTCSSWSGSGSNGNWGRADSTGPGWIDSENDSYSTDPCTNTHTILCIQQ